VNVKTFLNKIRKTIKENKAATQASLIKLLNPLISGWVNYHRHVSARKTFESVDKEIWQALWQWAKRRHPNKGRHWIKEKYFKTMPGVRSWIFALETGETLPNGKPKWIELRRATAIPIKRHVKIKADANPFDKQWELYFEDRLGFKMRDNLKQKKRLLNLWSSQSGRCPVCDQLIKQETGWHVHHILPRCEGGKDTLASYT